MLRLLLTCMSQNMESLADGYAVAEADLEYRGAGEIWGTRQAGEARSGFLRFARCVRWCMPVAMFQMAPGCQAPTTTCVVRRWCLRSSCCDSMVWIRNPGHGRCWRRCGTWSQRRATCGPPQCRSCRTGPTLLFDYYELLDATIVVSTPSWVATIPHSNVRRSRMPFSLLNLSLLSGNKEKQEKGGKTDLLLRFFDSQFFDEWICITYAVPYAAAIVRQPQQRDATPWRHPLCTCILIMCPAASSRAYTRCRVAIASRHLVPRYLYKSNQQGIQDYLCNRLYDLPEQGIERYLSQLTQLLVQRQNPLLDKVVVDLCARSLRIAVKVRTGPTRGTRLYSTPHMHRRIGFCWLFRKTSPRTNTSPMSGPAANRPPWRATGYAHCAQ